MFLTIESKSVASAWIEALQRVFFEGDEIKTQYDAEGDFPSRDCTSAIHVTEPLSEPMQVRGKPYLHDGSPIYCHPADVYCFEAIVNSGYLSEVMSGERDHLIIENTRTGGKSYPYTYHDRLFAWKPVNEEDFPYLPASLGDGDAKLDKEFILIRAKVDWLSFPAIDQIESCIKQLKNVPYTRRAQAITWRPLADNLRDDGPCLQRIWLRIFDGKLRMNAHWRSRDLFGAWEANVNGMLQIGQYIAEQTGIELGEYFDFCDSLHVYGRVKLVFKEILPLLERVRNKEGLCDEKYDEKLDEWLKLARSTAN